MGRAQTATEYLIILAVVIIIALIVVGVLGGIPGIGTGTDSNVNAAYWATAPVGIDSVKASMTEEDSITFRNNLQDTITIDHVFFGPQTIKTTDYDITIKPGETFTYQSRLLEDYGTSAYYTWHFKDCLNSSWGWYSDGDPGGVMGFSVVEQGIIGFGTVDYYTVGAVGDTFSEIMTIGYTNTKTGASYVEISEQPLTGTCAN